MSNGLGISRAGRDLSCEQLPAPVMLLLDDLLQSHGNSDPAMRTKGHGLDVPATSNTSLQHILPASDSANAEAAFTQLALILASTQDDTGKA